MKQQLRTCKNFFFTCLFPVSSYLKKKEEGKKYFVKTQAQSQKMFLHVLNSCCIFYLHFKKSSVILCYLNPIFCHSFLLYSTPCFRCKDQLLLNLFFLLFFFIQDCTGEKEVKKNFFLVSS